MLGVGLGVGVGSGVVVGACGWVDEVWVGVIGLLSCPMDMFRRRGAPTTDADGCAYLGVWVWCRCGIGVV